MEQIVNLNDDAIHRWQRFSLRDILYRETLACVTNGYDDKYNDNDNEKASAEDYEIQDYDNIFQDNEPVAVMCEYIADDASFVSSSSIYLFTSTDYYIQGLS